MTDTPELPVADDAITQDQRTFLVVVDGSEELRAGLRYACRRAMHTGGNVALFKHVGNADFHHFAAIGEIMEREARSDAERQLQQAAADVIDATGRLPALYLAEGDLIKELVQLVQEHPEITVLVLSASTGPEGPGPLVSSLSGKNAAKLIVPVTIVPGDLSDEAIDQLT